MTSVPHRGCVRDCILNIPFPAGRLKNRAEFIVTRDGDTTPMGLNRDTMDAPRVARSRNPGLWDIAPLGHS